MGKILIPLADGLEEIEAITIIDVLRRADIDVVTCSISQDLEVTGSHQIIIKADVLLKDLNQKEIEGVILPGGMPGAENLKQTEQLVQIIKDVNQAEGLVAAICAAPMVLEKAGVLTGKQATSYPDFAEEMPSCNYREERVVVDGNLITSRGPGVALEFSYTIVEYLLDEIQAEDLKKKMIFL